jgi:hypothetical protein
MSGAFRKAGWVAIAALALCAGCPTADGASGEPDRFADLGTPEDGDGARDVSIAQDHAWGGEGKWREFIRYEKADDFRWATAPPDPTGYVTARVVKSWYAGELRVRPFASRPPTLYVAIRYKDNLPSPATVSVRDGGDFVAVGTIGGKRDHAWRTQVYAVDGGRVGVADGSYRVRIGKADYGDLMGDLPIDWVRVSGRPIAADPDAPGYYPARPKSPFDDLGRTQVYRAGAKATFPVGVMVKGLRPNTFETVAKAGLNSAFLLGWETTWGPRHDLYTDGRWTDRLNAGLPNMLEMAQRARVPFSPAFATDTRSYWIQHQYKSERAALREMEDAMRRNRDHAALLAWYLKDEADHDDWTWGAPEEFVQSLYVAQKRADPGRPAFVNFQGWKPGQYRRYIDSADVLGFDVYPIGRGKDGAEIAEYTDRLRTEVAGRRAIWAIVEGHEGVHRKAMGRALTPREVLVQGYIAITHGIQGVIFYIDNEAAYIDPSEIPTVWDGMAQAAREVAGPGGIEPYLVPPGKAIELAGVLDRVRPGNASVHASLHEGPDGSRLLIAVNLAREDQGNVAIRVRDLADGPATVLFEDRTVAATSGTIADRFDGFARHVYRLPPPK